MVVVGIFAVAMGLFEAVLVVYIREIFYPNGFSFPLNTGPVRLLSVELLREAATIVMIVCVSIIAGNNRMQRFACFLYIFGVWDIFYYVGLKLILNWPESFLTWDVLFLIPVIWVGPVLAPVLCSLAMITLAGTILFFQEKGYVVMFGKTGWTLLLSGAGVVFCTFISDFGIRIIGEGLLPEVFALTRNQRFLRLLSEYVPVHFHWFFFTFGMVLIAAGTVLLILKTKKRR